MCGDDQLRCPELLSLCEPRGSAATARARDGIFDGSFAPDLRVGPTHIRVDKNALFSETSDAIAWQQSGCKSSISTMETATCGRSSPHSRDCGRSKPGWRRP